MLQPLGEEAFMLILNALGKGRGPELFTFITSNKNKNKSKINIKVIIGAIKAQLPI
jgi:hypothetical protein